jgi:uncharacterized membrane protein
MSSGSIPRPVRGRVEHLSQRARRLIVVVAYLSLPEAAILFCFHAGAPSLPPSSPQSWALSVSLLEFLVLAQVGLAGEVLERGWRAAIGANGLDERQRQLRDRASYLSYRIVGVGAVIPVVILCGALLTVPFNSWGSVTLDPTSLFALMICVSVLCLCLNLLPIAAVAWLEPDAPAEV